MPFSKEADSPVDALMPPSPDEEVDVERINVIRYCKQHENVWCGKLCLLYGTPDGPIVITVGIQVLDKDHNEFRADVLDAMVEAARRKVDEWRDGKWTGVA